MIQFSVVCSGLIVELELEVGVVELVDANVSVLAAAGIAPPRGVELDWVDGAKVTLHAGKLLVEHHVEEAGVELADTRRGSSDLNRVDINEERFVKHSLRIPDTR